MSTYSNDPVPFGAVDYIVFSVMLTISTATGLYHGFAKGGQQSTSRYLLADKKMHFLPVAMSLLVSMTSPLGLLGTPSEVYVHGIAHITALLGLLWCLPLGAFIFVPVFHDINITSAYEYMELRFNFTLRIIVAVIFMLQSVFYTAANLIGPALALDAVLGISIWQTMIVTGALCTIYTALGGMKAVIWTDVFQFFVIFGTLFTVIVMGVVTAGGFEEVFRINADHGRLDAFSFDFDPTIRISFFSAVFGSGIGFSPTYVSQTAVQRYMTVRSVRHSQATLLINIPLLYITLPILYLAGLVLFAFYNNDLTPLQLAINTSSTDLPNYMPSGGADARYEPNFMSADQILVYFVSSQLGHIHGIQGLFIAGLFAGALSSVSTSLNSMTAVTLVDFIKPYRKWKAARQGKEIYKNDKRDTIVSKVLTCVYGLIGIGLAFVTSRLGSLLVLATTILGVTGGPAFGAFTVGMVYRRANSIGTLFGTVLGFAFGLLISLGAYANQGSTEDVAAIYRLSFLMYAAYSFAVTVLIGILVSEFVNICFRKGIVQPVDPLLLTRILRPSNLKTADNHVGISNHEEYSEIQARIG
ncbi:sodium-dependent multivitamin transporter-like [Ptychodera flava]|uniref:sodium-dependent multivitamin transporter-like n=1 Tax=Ptychodera flava TaxID=63121 RepID=UPI00396A96A5